MPSPDGLITSREISQDAIVSRHITHGTINDEAMFHPTIQPVQRVDVLGVCSQAELGQFAYLVPDGLLYKCDGGSWVNATDVSELTGEITTTQIADDAVTTPKLSAGAVIASKITAGTSTAHEIAADTITAGEIAADTITAQEIAAHTITAEEIDADAITADIIVGGTINTTEIIVGSTMTLAGSGVIQTAESGQRVEITAADHDRIAFHSGDALEPVDGPSHIVADSYGTDPAPRLTIRGPQADWGTDTPDGSWFSHFQQPHDQDGDPALEIGYDGEATGTPYMLLDEHMVLGAGAQIFLTAAGIDDDPSQAIMPGVLTKMDPPTWKAETTDPTPSAYNDNSVGFWIRVGNEVWFSIVFVYNDSGVGTGDNGSGDYYWDPAADGAPAVDSSIYGNSENQFITCGVMYADPSAGSTIYGAAEIDNTNSRIYARYDLFRVDRTHPFAFDESEVLILSGTYIATP